MSKCVVGSCVSLIVIAYRRLVQSSAKQLVSSSMIALASCCCQPVITACFSGACHRQCNRNYISKLDGLLGVTESVHNAWFSRSVSSIWCGPLFVCTQVLWTSEGAEQGVDLVSGATCEHHWQSVASLEVMIMSVDAASCILHDSCNHYYDQLRPSEGKFSEVVLRILMMHVAWICCTYSVSNQQNVPSWANAGHDAGLIWAAAALRPLRQSALLCCFKLASNTTAALDTTQILHRKTIGGTPRTGCGNAQKTDMREQASQMS